MLTKADISGIVLKYGPSISKRYYTLKKTPVRMLSNAFLTFANQDKIMNSVAFVDISADRSGSCGLIISRLGIHFGLENSKGFIEFSKVKACVVEFPKNGGSEQSDAILRVSCDDGEYILDGDFAKAPLKHIIEEAHAICVRLSCVSEPLPQEYTAHTAMPESEQCKSDDIHEEAVLCDIVEEFPDEAEQLDISEKNDGSDEAESPDVPSTEPVNRVNSEANEARIARFEEIRLKARRELEKLNGPNRNIAPSAKPQSPAPLTSLGSIGRLSPPISPYLNTKVTSSAVNGTSAMKIDSAREASAKNTENAVEQVVIQPAEDIRGKTNLQQSEALQSTEVAAQSIEAPEPVAQEAPVQSETTEQAALKSTAPLESDYVRKPTSAIGAQSAEERAAHFKEIREKAQKETAEIAEIKARRAAQEAAKTQSPAVSEKHTGTESVVPKTNEVVIAAPLSDKTEDEKSSVQLTENQENEAAEVQNTAVSEKHTSTESVVPKTNEVVIAAPLSNKTEDEKSSVQLTENQENEAAEVQNTAVSEKHTSTESVVPKTNEVVIAAPLSDKTEDEKNTAQPDNFAENAAQPEYKTEEPDKSDYIRKPTSLIVTPSSEERAAHFKEIREKAQKETAEIAELKSGHAPLTKECRAPLKPKPNPAPFGYTETIISEMTISKNDITDIYMQEVIALSPNPDIYTRSAEVVKNLMKKDSSLTDEKIKEYLRENLTLATERFIGAVKAHREKIPPRTMHSIEVLDEAVKGIGKYTKQGEAFSSRVMLFMTFQMITYTDNILQSDKTKAVCMNFIKTFGALGIILSMLDLELY